MKRREVLNKGIMLLKESGVPAPDIDAAELLASFLGKTRYELMLSMNEEMSESEEKGYAYILQRRAERIPLQHIVGVVEFCGIPIRTDERALIPRFDTECLVEAVLKDEKKREGERSLLDLCTGSGCIAIALSKMGRFRRVSATELSEDAYELAKENIELQNAPVELKLGDSFLPFLGETFDVVTANPPYLREDEVNDAEDEVRFHEPRLALIAENDGYAFYETWIPRLPEILSEGASVYMEVGDGMADKVAEIFRSAGFREIGVVKDYGGLDRVVRAEWRKS